MNIETMQKQIEKTDYWDTPILDIQTKFFCDEVYLFIEKDNEACWKISFTSCYKVDYITDANWRGIAAVKGMRGGQLGYYGQDITLEKYIETDESVKRSIEKYGGTDDFIRCSLDLSIMTMTIVCKDILVEEINLADISFFWEEK